MIDAQARLFDALARIPETHDPGYGGGWMQRAIKMGGSETMQPRLTCAFGLEGATYR